MMAMFRVIAGAVSEPRWAILHDPTAEDRGAADGGRGSPPTKVVVAQLSEDWRSAHTSWSEEMAVEWEGVGGMGDADEEEEEELCFFLCAPESRGRSSHRNLALLRRANSLNPSRTPGDPSMATSSASHRLKAGSDPTHQKNPAPSRAHVHGSAANGCGP